MREDIFTTNKRYDVIYADPPWRYYTYSDKGKGRSAESHYPTMAKEEIQQLPVERISSKNSVLFLWVTAPCLIEGIELIKAWGYTYKTVAFTWVKQCKRNMIYVFLATAGVWSIGMGIAMIIAKKNEEKEKAKKMLVNYCIGLVVIFVILVALPHHILFVELPP